MLLFAANLEFHSDHSKTTVILKKSFIVFWFCFLLIYSSLYFESLRNTIQKNLTVSYHLQAVRDLG